MGTWVWAGNGAGVCGCSGGDGWGACWPSSGCPQRVAVAGRAVPSQGPDSLCLTVLLLQGCLLRSTLTFSVARKGNSSDLSFPEILSFLDISFKNLPLVVFSLPHALSVFFPLLFLQMAHQESFPLMTVSSLPSLAGIWFCGFEAVQ